MIPKESQWEDLWNHIALSVKPSIHSFIYLTQNLNGLNARHRVPVGEQISHIVT